CATLRLPISLTSLFESAAWTGKPAKATTARTTSAFKTVCLPSSDAIPVHLTPNRCLKLRPGYPGAGFPISSLRRDVKSAGNADARQAGGPRRSRARDTILWREDKEPG